MDETQVITSTDMHTGGEPLRIITSGYPEIKGETILEKRRFVKDNLDNLRTFLMHEPRGHYDQYGALLVPADHPEADIGVIFMHNEGYSTMCGHAVIALGRYIVDNKLMRQPVVDGSKEVLTKIQCPCGLVEARVAINGGTSAAVKFVSVPSFAFKTDLTIKTLNYGDVTLDIGYGGAFYALVDVRQTQFDVCNTHVSKLIEFAHEVTETVKEVCPCKHPVEIDLSFLYGTILTDGKDEYSDESTNNLCVFADRQVDRSPTGSGVTARLAVQYAKQQIKMNQERIFRNSKVGSIFHGKVVRETKCGEFDAVQVQVKGEAFYTGTCQFTVEKNDELRKGFLVQ